ncbi:unnamed protein product [Lathyrus sativus]|nr:unnamed protein product [Lathyrus sativus]
MMLDATPTKDNLPTSYYDAKILVSKLGLEVRKIDCCINGCMLFYDNEFGIMMRRWRNVSSVRFRDIKFIVKPLTINKNV